MPATGESRQRWVVLSLLFVVTVLNFVDRQTLSILAPQLRETYQFSATEYGRIVSAFQFGMMAAEFPMGWLMDRVGVRTGLAFAVLWWSIATGLHAGARTVWHFALLRFWMGTGECGNYSGGTKLVTQWFAPTQRALGIGVFNSGSMVGSIVAPPLVVFLARTYGYQTAFLVPAALGLLWVIAWLLLYPRETGSEALTATSARPQESNWPARQLFRDRRAWAVMACRFFVGPVMQFYWYWMPDYLYHVRGLSLLAIGALSWIPFLLGDVGSIAGGWFSGHLLRKGWDARHARRTTMTIGAALCLFSLLVFLAPTLPIAIAVIGLVLFGHTFLSANMFSSVSDLFSERAVGRVVGLTGVSGGLSGLLFPLLTGYLVDHLSYFPVFCFVAVMPAVGVAALFALTRARDWEGR